MASSASSGKVSPSPPPRAWASSWSSVLLMPPHPASRRAAPSTNTTPRLPTGGTLDVRPRRLDGTKGGDGDIDAMRPAGDPGAVHRVAIVVFPGVQPLDAVG